MARFLTRFMSGFLVLLALWAVRSHAQSATSLVQWSASAVATPAQADPRQLEIRISARITPGWHVYATKQLGSGPIPLRIAVDDNPLAAATGEPAGPAPQRAPDRGFGFDTFYFADAVEWRLPVRLKEGNGGAPRTIPVSVRFQACSEQECRPPTTIHLSVTA